MSYIRIGIRKYCCYCCYKDTLIPKISEKDDDWEPHDEVQVTERDLIAPKSPTEKINDSNNSNTLEDSPTEKDADAPVDKKKVAVDGWQLFYTGDSQKLEIELSSTNLGGE